MLRKRVQGSRYGVMCLDIVQYASKEEELPFSGYENSSMQLHGQERHCWCKPRRTWRALSIYELQRILNVLGDLRSSDTTNCFSLEIRIVLNNKLQHLVNTYFESLKE